MNILANIKLVLGIMGFHKQVHPGDKAKDIVHRLLYFAALLCTTVSFVWYILDEPEVIMEPMFGVVNAISITSIYIGFAIRCEQLLDLFDDIQMKIEEREFITFSFRANIASSG